MFLEYRFGKFKLIQDIACSFLKQIIQCHPASCLDRPISEENRLVPCDAFRAGLIFLEKKSIKRVLIVKISS
jgi:hypothetical protein